MRWTKANTSARTRRILISEHCFASKLRDLRDAIRRVSMVAFGREIITNRNLAADIAWLMLGVMATSANAVDESDHTGSFPT